MTVLMHEEEEEKGEEEKEEDVHLHQHISMKLHECLAAAPSSCIQ